MHINWGSSPGVTIWGVISGGLISRGLSPAFVTRLPFRDAAEHRVNTVDIEHNAVTVFTRSVAFIVSQTTNSDSSDVR